MSHFITTSATLMSVVSNTTVVIPANYTILQIIIENTTGNAILGGVKIGTTNGGTEVATTIGVSASSLLAVSDSSLLKCVFSTSGDTTLYIQAVTLWNSASINVHFVLRSFK